MTNPLLFGKVIKAGANAFDYKLSPLQEKLLDPVGAAKDYLTGKAESALGVPKDSIALATDPKGFAGNVLKDTVKDYFKDRSEIPEEDRSKPDPSNFNSREQADDFGKYGLGVSRFGGGKGFEAEIDLSDDFDRYKRGGKVKSVAKTKVNTASRRGDGIAQRGKTKGRYL